MKLKKVNSKYYNSLFNEYGHSTKSLGWKGKSNDYRFKCLIENFEIKNNSILDVGCGLGHLIKFLGKKKFKYTGIDINKNFIKVNKLKFKKNYKFFDKDIFKLDENQNFDYVIQNGLLNLKIPNVNKYHQSELLLKKMFKLANIGASCNFLSSNAKIKYKKNNYFAPEKILKICYKLTNNVLLKNNYFPYEFSVTLFKEVKIKPDSHFINLKL